MFENTILRESVSSVEWA